MATIHPSKVVSIHPYFRAKPGKLAEAKAFLPKFVEQSRTEPAILYYDFSINGDMIFCREAYVGAAGLEAHLANVSALLSQFDQLVDIVRLEIHGAAEEVDKLKPTLAGLSPEYYVHECGLVR